jgi:hypothetical protein
MAGGWLTKQADLLTARFLNDVNDSSAGGTIFALPSGVTPPPYSQTIPGDRIVLDDATAFALSDTTVGTLFGGVYMYVGTLSTSTNSPGRGQIAFWGNAQLPPNTPSGTLAYTVTADAQPTNSSVPTFIAGIFLNAATKGNFCWVQVAGVASVLYDQSLSGQQNIGLTVTSKITSNASTPGSADCGAAITTTTIAALLGVAVSSPVASTISQVIMTRGMFCGRI